MKSTGEVMGIDETFGKAYAKAQLAAGQRLPTRGRVFISVKDRDKRPMLFIAKKLRDMGFDLFATRGTARTLAMNGIEVTTVAKVSEGGATVVDLVRQGLVDLIINTPSGRTPRKDEVIIRSTAVSHGIPLVTTVAGAAATVIAIETAKHTALGVRALQDYHRLGAVAGTG